MDHPLCPVHRDTDTAPAIIVWGGRTSAIVGPAYALASALARMGAPQEISWHVAAWPELPPAHPHQFLVMPVEVADADPDFIDFGNGAFFIPQGTSIEKSPQGDLCVYRAIPERHTQVSARPISGLN